MPEGPQAGASSFRARRPRRAPTSVVPRAGVTVYGCRSEDADLFREAAPRLGIRLTVVPEPLSDVNVALAAGSRCVSVDHKRRVPSTILDALRRHGVGYLCTRSVGYDHIDLVHARSVGIVVGNVCYSPDSVADYTLMLMLMAARSAAAMLRRTAAHDYRLPERRGRELRDLTVGVVGTGRIGTAVIERLAGFGCRILACDYRPTSGVGHVPLDELLQRSDIVTLHTPLTPETHHLLSRRRIEHMKPGAIVVNTARGSVIDTAALVTALERGLLGAAALDVIEGEEGIFYGDRRQTPIDNPLLLRLHKLPNVVITPHLAYYTDHSLRDIVENTILNCLEFEQGAAWTG